MMEDWPRMTVDRGTQKWLNSDYIMKIGYTGFANE